MTNKNTEIKEIDINKITPDRAQPRTSIDEIDLKEMAKNIVAEGVINPIEVDEELVIVTGERRWRAAKIAGLKTVPAKVMDIGKDERLWRQVSENIHHNAMSDWDMANALERLLTLLPGNRVAHTPLVGPGADKGITMLSERIGKSRSYIDEKLAILASSEPFQKAVKSGDISGSFIRAINRVPEKFKEAIEKKVLKGEFKTREGALGLAVALKREEKNPHITKKLLDVDYSKYKGSAEVGEAIEKISPSTTTLISQTYEPSKEISRIGDELKDWVRNNPREKIGLFHAPRVLMNMNFIKALVEEWFKGEKEEAPSIDSEVRLLN